MEIKNYNLLNKKKHKDKNLFICFSNVFKKCFLILFVLLILSISNLVFTNFLETVEACINSFFDCFDGEFVRIFNFYLWN